MAQLFISLGSNIDREYYLEQGLNALESAFGCLQLSSLFESEAVGFDGKPFYNMVIGVSTTLSLSDVSHLLRTIEFNNGRSENAKKFSPRTLDLDILLYDDVIATHPQIPRDEITKNAFVLWPLAELAPQLKHPVLEKSYETLWQQYDQNLQQLKKVPLLWTAKNKEIS